MSENTATVPMHVGIILDGNRRWAKENGLSSLEGHKKGSEVFRDIAQAALDRGVKYMSAFVFSSENWNRSKEEVAYLMDLFIWMAKKEAKELAKKNIKVCFLGERTNLSPKLLKAMDDAEEKTKDNTKGTVLFCLNYGGKQEIVSAVNKILQKNPGATSITEEQIIENLYQPEVPPVDFVIRTSGEHRLSNFMLWRSAYSELYFAKKHWPAFTKDDLNEALDKYASRQRRFGK